ncbi:TrmH family RNA methyltransferase [Maribacter aestuarii]|uniref:TrmH family RNA methyltransferase n=1 Tax=Maribacter aestuarii TaxID=1130723 RepID=UPI003221B57E
MKLIKSLHQKKYRTQHGLFIVEGIKAVEEVLNSDFKVHKIFASTPIASNVLTDMVTLISARELAQMSSLTNPNGVLGVFHIPEPKKVVSSDWILVLDDVQDPGNMGTIIRLCDWFGIQHLVCSEHTVDCYNPKVLQATMGSITRVNIVYLDLAEFLQSVQLPIYGSFMSGTSISQTKLPEKGVLIMGNEGKGISGRIKEFCEHTIAIPQYGSKTAESLNVATATSILLNEIRRE